MKPHDVLDVSALHRGFFLNFSSLAYTILYKMFNLISRSCFLYYCWMILLMRRIAFRSFAKKWFLTPLSVLHTSASTDLPDEQQSLPICCQARHANAVAPIIIQGSSSPSDSEDSDDYCTFRDIVCRFG